MPETVNHTVDEAVEKAVELYMAGMFAESVQWCKGVLRIDPNHVEAHQQMGVSLSELFLYEKRAGRDGQPEYVPVKRWAEALYHFDQALKGKPDHHVALANRGSALSELGDVTAGLVSLRRSTQIKPKNPIAWHNMGVLLEKLERYDEALGCYERVLHQEPNHASTHYCRGIVLRKIGRYEEALREFNEQVRRFPEDMQARYNRATANLALGNLAAGFEEYESRLAHEDHQKPLYGPFPQPRWKGEDISGKTILVCAEQGVGDAIHFLRYVEPVVARAGRVLLAVHEPIRDLVEIPGVEVMVPGAAWPAFDLQVNLMSLPFALGYAKMIPPPWRPDVAPAAMPRGRIGVCWSGQFQHKNNAHRSIPLEQFRRALAPGRSYVSLQQHVWPADADAFRKLFGEKLITLVDLATYRATCQTLAALDLVVTVDTSVAHMAASMGVPTWILIPKHATDWRWLVDRSDSIWYPSARLFRQREIGDWDSVLDEVRRELETVSESADRRAVA